MNNRLKAARKELRLTQREFGARVGVQDTAISKLEKGENGLTDQMVIAVCREYGINETWLRTGDGEMFVVSENALIAQLSEQYNLDGLDQKILEGYITLPETHREVIKGFVRKIAEAVNVSSAELAEEILPPVVTTVGAREDEKRIEWNKGLSREEMHALLDARIDVAKKGDVSSTTSAKVGTDSTLNLKKVEGV